MLLVVFALIVGVSLGVFLARRYKGNTADKLHLAATYSILFMTLAVIATIVIMRLI